MINFRFWVSAVLGTTKWQRQGGPIQFRFISVPVRMLSAKSQVVLDYQLTLAYVAAAQAVAD